jgi:NADH-quinone oxidoreductase subunit L
MFRLLFMTFYGQERFDTHHVHPHESPPAMLTPLKILAVLSIIGGFIVGIPPENGLFHRFLAHAFHHGAHHAHAFHVWPDVFLMLLSTLVALAGFVTAYHLYLENPAGAQSLSSKVTAALRTLVHVAFKNVVVESFYTTRPRRLAERFSFAYQVLLNKYYIDEFYDAFIVRPVMWGMQALWTVDARVVDGIVNSCARFTRLYANWSGILDRLVVDGSVNGVAVLVQSGARAFRLIQTGIVQNYLLVMAFGVFIFATIYLVFT